jgi:exodeoxyribonuclease VII large subunit
MENNEYFMKEFEERKKRLATEGLFASDRKKTIPKNAKKIGIICEPESAVIKDIQSIAKKLNSSKSIIILPISKCYNEISHSIVSQIQNANLNSTCDILIIANGSGTIEELLPWSEENVVRAISQSQLPIISAVGHEIDWPLCDYAADLRASTPSEAAEIVFSEIRC